MSVLERYANIDDRANISPKPTLVAMEELQLHDLQKADAAVPPIQIMQPEKRELATVPIPPVRRGMDSRAPMSQQDVEGYVKRRRDKTRRGG